MLTETEMEYVRTRMQEFGCSFENANEKIEKMMKQLQSGVITKQQKEEAKVIRSLYRRR